MISLPQLIMRKTDLSCLPQLVLPQGYSIHAHTEGMEAVWESIIASAFGSHFDFSFLINAGNYHPKHVLYLNCNGQDIATATAVEHPNYPGEGWFRMVGVRKEAHSNGYGKLIVLAALHVLHQRGYKSAVLSTDDFRISAICTYLSLGFRPVYCHESHPQRWEQLKSQLPAKYSSLI